MSQHDEKDCFVEFVSRRTGRSILAVERPTTVQNGPDYFKGQDTRGPRKVNRIWLRKVTKGTVLGVSFFYHKHVMWPRLPTPTNPDLRRSTLIGAKILH